MRISALLLGAALIAATPALAGDRDTTPEAQLAKALEGRVAGQPVDCISLPRVNGSRVFDKTAIVYESGSTLYVNRPSIGAESLDDDDILVSKTIGSQLCRMDTINLVDRASRFQRGFVGLGSFVPYTKPRAQ